MWCEACLPPPPGRLGHQRTGLHRVVAAVGGKEVDHLLGVCAESECCEVQTLLGAVPKVASVEGLLCHQRLPFKVRKQHERPALPVATLVPNRFATCA